MTVAYPFNETDGLELSEAYAAARDADGMIRVRLPYGEPAWLATRYADARFVLGDKRFSRAMAAERDEPRMSEGRRPDSILGMDPPDHTRLRRLVAKAFTIRRVEQLRPSVRALSERCLDDLIAQGPPVDLVENFALPIPVAVICELLGVPVGDRPLFRAFSDASLSTSRLTAEETAETFREFDDYMRGLVAQRRAEPADDLMTDLIAARDERDKLTEDELVSMCRGILVAGHETTASQIPNFVFVLAERPDKWAQLCADPELVKPAVEELMRFVPLGAGSGFPRYASEDVEVGGVLVRRGEPVLVAIGAANRDGLRFDAADEVRFDREENQHLGFGHGVHHCLGAPLARVELQEALRTLVTRLPNLRLAGDPAWKKEMLVRGPRTMPIAW